MKLFDEYSWGAVNPIESRIIAMRGVDDPLTTTNQMGAWQVCTRAPCSSVVTLAGAHLPTRECIACLRRMLDDHATLAQRSDA